MATRLYGVATTAAPVSPAFDTNWQSTTGAVRRSLSTAKAASTETRATVDVTSGSGNETLGFQLVSEPLNAGAITGTVTIVSRGRELATTDNVALKVHSIRVFSDDGNTLRGTSLAFANGSNTTELGTTLQGNIHTSAVSLTSVTAQTGDRIVVELGYGMNTTGTTPQYDMVIGGNGTDHTTTQGDTTGTVPWIEFSQNLSFIGPITGLQDDFNDNSTDTGKWTTGGTVSETGGQLVCTPIVDAVGWDYSRYESVRGYSLVGMALVVQVPQVLNDTGGTDETMLAFGVGVDDYLAIFKTGTSLVFRDRSEVTANDTSVTYSATDHAWWRIRESGGTVFFDTSPDGVTWTNQRSRVPTDPDFLNAALVRIQAGQWSAGGSPGTAIFDNLNGVPTQLAPGTGVAADPVAAAGGNAETTSAAGVAQNPSSAVTANAETTSAAGVAPDGTAAATANAGTTSAPGVALDATVTAVGGTDAAAETTTAAGVAQDGTAAAAASAETTSAPGTALDATVSALAQTDAQAETTTAAGVAQDPSSAVTASAETASATATAQDPASAVTVPADTTTAAGAASDATVSTLAQTDAQAETATAAGVAQDPASAVTANAETTSATGAALDATAAAAVSAGTTTAAGVAQDPASAVTANAETTTAAGVALDATVTTSSAASAQAETTTGTGTANDPTAAVTANAGTTTAAGAAPDATVSTLTQTSAQAELASGSGTAADASIASSVPAELATGSGDASPATGQAGRDVPAGTSTATVSALDASGAVTVPAGLAAAIAAVYDAVAVTAPEIIKGTGSVSLDLAATGSVHLDRAASSSVELAGAASAGVTID